MPLNIVNDGDFDPYVKYNVKSGRWFLKQDNDDVEVSSPVFVADLDNIKTGWFFFKAGQAPQKVFDESLSNQSARPDVKYTDDKGKERFAYNRGFEVRLFSQNSFGGVVVLNGASQTFNSAMNDLYIMYEAGKEANSGMLPVVKFSGSEPIKTDFGTNYKPLFEIVKWVPRPAELDAAPTTTNEAKQATQEPVQATEAAITPEF